ncbi:MAG: sporulation integral membrane protein YlbJ [Syntrophomonadaceae bacterium]|nr:sporulation integral membrane protein YlbJ [Syntrophomonadaceae bacterium]
MIINPGETVNAAANGFKLWYNILVPALLPFFIIAELMVNIGLVRFIGVLLEPIMRPLFKLPGCSSLVVVMGFTSGFPVGAILSKKLYEENMLTANETERLVSFTNNSSPLFIIGAIGIGMFNSAAFGYLLAASHYLANLLVGLFWRFKAITPVIPKENKVTIKSAFSQLVNAQTAGIGKILGDAIRNSINNILAIAGFIIFFSVLTRMLIVWGIMDYFALLVSNYLAFLNIPYPVAYGLGIGLFEVTLGANTISITNSEPIIKLLTVSLLLAFSGFSIIAQVMSVVATAPVRFSFYLKSRLLQISLSLVFTYLGYHLFLKNAHHIPAISSLPYYKILYGFDAWTFSITCLVIGLCIIAILMFISILINN